MAVLLFPFHVQGLARQFGIQGFPTILVFGKDKSNPTPYEGQRSAAAIEEFALSLLEEMLVAPEVPELTGPVSGQRRSTDHWCLAMPTSYNITCRAFSAG